ncbi:unnamed protein product [Polarella glacialis]|uniref:Uncharacterized protein n=1 Tax=Polarella glacialis TaxID=89957 RepID=A0A813IKI5_POLGL|nr:unnamed protein product [Polarella glacialis]
MEVTQIIAWIHRVMLTGLKPATDHLGCEWPPGSRRAMEAGSPFARQLLGAFAGFKSDLEARVLCHRLPRSYMHNFVCEHDLACVHLAHLQYGDFRSTAGWRTSAITHEDYMITSESSMSPWAEVPGWRKERTLDDTLHDIYQGIGPHLVASTIVHCILEEIPKCTLEKLDLKLKSLYTNSYKPWCRENKTDSAGNSFSGVKFNREKSNKTYPELGSVYKAYEVKVIIFWAAFYCKDKLGSFQGRVRAMCLYSLASWIRVLDLAGGWLTNDEVESACKFGEQFLLCYQYLAGASLQAKVCLYKIIPKFHYFCHMLIYMKLTKRNVRFDACWMEEDLMGKLTNMSSKTHARTFVVSVLTRYCCLVSVVDSMTASAKLKKP